VICASSSLQSSAAGGRASRQETYGLSIESGERIPDERLELRPTAELTTEEERRAALVGAGAPRSADLGRHRTFRGDEVEVDRWSVR